jgi:hypothetical protein
MHIRRFFLESLRTQLKTLPNYGGVWIQRAAPQRSAYPAITLFTDNETAETLSIHAPARPQDRLLTVSVIIWIKGTQDDEKAEIDMDASAADVEGVLRRPVGADDLYLVATDFQFAEDEPDIHAVTLTYKISYNTTEFSPVV